MRLTTRLRFCASDPAPLDDDHFAAGISGEGYNAGGANDTRLNGTYNVALQKGEIIVVTHSYRLGIFGFVASGDLTMRDPTAGTTGNYGIQDQRAAMQWTSENIGQFGGDPEKIFIVGHGGGANSVSQHLVRPASWPYFSSAGMLGGAFADGMDTPTVEDQEDHWDRLCEYLNCTYQYGHISARQRVSCVATTPMEVLREADYRDHHPWTATIDGRDLTDNGWVLAVRGQLAQVPILAGAAREDLTAPMRIAVESTVSAAPRCEKEFECTEDDFRAFGLSLGLDTYEQQQLVRFHLAL